MNEQPMFEHDLEKQVQEFARGFEYPATPNIARALPRVSKIRTRHRRQTTISVMAYAMGAALILMFSALLLSRINLSRDDIPVTVIPDEMLSAEEAPIRNAALPAYPPNLGHPDTVFYQYDDTGYSVILVWQKSNRPGVPAYQPVANFGKGDIASYVMQQSLLSRNTYFQNPLNRKQPQTQLYEQKLAGGETLIWQVTRIPYRR